ncbi:MAG: hypothetical protein ACXVHS_09845 [Methanobacterium sp.]
MPIKFIKNQTFIIESVENNMAVLKGQDKNNEYNEIVNEGKPLDMKMLDSKVDRPKINNNGLSNIF